MSYAKATIRLIFWAVLAAFAIASGQAMAQFSNNGYWGGNSGSSTSYRGSDYGAGDTRAIQQVITGRVEDVRVVEITTRGQASQYIGAGLGGAVGAIAARKVGNGSGSQIASIVGGAVGALVGQAVGDRIGRETRQAIEVVVALDRGQVVAITQEIDQNAATLRSGDRVRLIQGSVTRVVKVNHPA